MNFIRFENHAINVDNVAYVTRSDDNRVVLTFCAGLDRWGTFAAQGLHVESQR